MAQMTATELGIREVKMTLQRWISADAEEILKPWPYVSLGSDESGHSALTQKRVIRAGKKRSVALFLTNFPVFLDALFVFLTAAICAL